MSDTLQPANIQAPQTMGLGAHHSFAKQVSDWKPRFWDNEHHESLQFATTEELDAAIDWLWSDPELRDMPRVHVGQNTMVVPSQAVDAFRQKGFRFVALQVRYMGDLTPQEAKRIRATG